MVRPPSPPIFLWILCNPRNTNNQWEQIGLSLVTSDKLDALMVNALAFGSSGLGSSPDQECGAVF